MPVINSQVSQQHGASCPFPKQNMCVLASQPLFPPRVSSTFSEPSIIPGTAETTPPKKHSFPTFRNSQWSQENSEATDKHRMAFFSTIKYNTRVQLSGQQGYSFKTENGTQDKPTDFSSKNNRWSVSSGRAGRSHSGPPAFPTSTFSGLSSQWLCKWSPEKAAISAPGQFSFSKSLCIFTSLDGRSDWIR